MQSFEEGVERIVLETADSAQRASMLAATLAARFPGMAHGVCLLRTDSGTATAVIDGTLKPQPVLARSIESLASSWPAQGEEPRWEQGLVAEPIAGPGRVWGFLGVAGGPAATREILRPLGRYVGLRLTLEEETRKRRQLEESLAHQRLLADSGQISRPVVHELYNLLNTLSLQLEVLKIKFPQEATKAEMGVLKKQIQGMAEVLKWFRQYRSTVTVPDRAIEINRLVRDVLASLRAEGRLTRPVDCDFAAEPLTLKGPEADAERLVRFLVMNTSEAGPLRLTTTHVEHKVSLSVEPFAENPAWELHQTVEAADGKDKSAALELATAKMLLERFRGKVQVEAVSPGFRVVIELPVKKAT